MKIVMTLIALSLSVSVFAKDCKKDVLKQFKVLTQDYEYHSLYNQFRDHPAGTESYTSFGRTVTLGFDFDVITYTASNEMWSGYGAFELIVDPKTCTILKMQEVYTE